MDRVGATELDWRELAACAAVLVAGIALLPAVGGSVLWTHPLWLDELCCTLYPTWSATSPMEVIANLAKRQDFAPPLLHLIVWTVGRVAGGMTPVLLRSIALASVALAALFVYAALRRRFDRTSSAGGALAIIAQPLVLIHAFEGRFYGPWLLFAAAYAWSVGRRDRIGVICQAVFAACVVTIHWFGIMALVIMAAAVAATHGRRVGDAMRAIAPSAAGVLAFLACAPLLMSQSAGATAFGWIEPFSAKQVVSMARVFWIAKVPAIAAIVIVLSVVLAVSLGVTAVSSRFLRALREPSVAALGSLCVFPLALVTVSLLVQPSMLERYAITAVLAWGPLVALAVEPLPRIPRVIAMAALLFQFRPGVLSSIATRDAFAKQVASDAAAFDRVRFTGVPVVFPWLHSLYPVAGPTRREPTPARLLDVPDSTLAQLYPGDRLAWFRNRTRVEVLSARSHTSVYGFPLVVTTAELDTIKRFAVMTSDLRVRGGLEQATNWGRIVFPHHTVLRLDDQVSLFVRK